MTTAPHDFDHQLLYEAVNARRLAEELSWPKLTVVIWEQSHVLNAQRRDHPISPATLRKMADGGGLTCQHALFLLRWLGVPPETFIYEPEPGTAGIPLPVADEAHRLRWNLHKLYTTLNAGRVARQLTWQQVAERLHCTPSQLTGLKSAKFATGMTLAMRITQVMKRPAADFVYVARW